MSVNCVYYSGHIFMTLFFNLGRIGMSTNSVLRQSSGILMTQACLSPVPLTRP